ncbi:hypothetical protein ACCI51_19010 [Microbulbifer echini]|uniref:Uncharacterized protein n=1 Tax=Microbulbifer echini TaxID=1529067 RepID=A0ABV4NT83_9GAMM
MKFEIDLSKGLGELKFGMSPNEVESILGSDQCFEEWMGGNLEAYYLYKGLIIGFCGGESEEPDTNSKVCIFTVKPTHSLILCGIDISHLDRDEIIIILDSIGISHKVLDNGIVQSESGKLQINFTVDGMLDELYFEQH